MANVETSCNFAMALALMLFGGGRGSIDYVIYKRSGKARQSQLFKTIASGPISEPLITKLSYGFGVLAIVFCASFYQYFFFGITGPTHHRFDIFHPHVSVSKLELKDIEGVVWRTSFAVKD